MTNEELEAMWERSEESRIEQLNGVGIENLRRSAYDVPALLDEIERLRKENKRLSGEIGRYSNKVFDIAETCYANGDEARYLINRMLRKEASE